MDNNNEDIYLAEEAKLLGT